MQLGQNLTYPKFHSWVAKGGLAIVDYGLYSGSNFLLGILLARWLTAMQYGAYALALSIAIFVGFLYQAILLEPLSVFAGTLFHDNLRGYLKAASWIHWAIAGVVCLGLAMAAGIAWRIGTAPILALALAGAAMAAPFIMMHSFGRRTFYLTLSPGPAAFGSAFYFVMVVAGVFVAFRRGWLSSFSAFLVMGMASLISVVVMLFQLNAILEPENGRPGIRQTWAKHWEYGRWALATCIVGWIPNYVYIPLVSGFSGMAAAGELRALMNLAGPVVQTYAALSMLFLPYASRVQVSGGHTATSNLTRKLTLLFVGGAVAYWAVVIPLRLSVFRLLYAGKYIDSSYLVPFFALETVVWGAGMGPAILLRAMESPQSLFWANGAASVVALVLGIPATLYYGLRGAVGSMILANTLYSGVAFLLYCRKVSGLEVVENQNLASLGRQGDIV
jgi:O-antigen/teichoic acid export membrane protein